MFNYQRVIIDFQGEQKDECKETNSGFSASYVSSSGGFGMREGAIRREDACRQGLGAVVPGFRGRF